MASADLWELAVHDDLDNERRLVMVLNPGPDIREKWSSAIEREIRWRSSSMNAIPRRWSIFFKIWTRKEPRFRSFRQLVVVMLTTAVSCRIYMYSESNEHYSKK